MDENQHLDSVTVEAIVRRVVESVEPERIILFGAAARGEIGPQAGADREPP